MRSTEALPLKERTAALIGGLTNLSSNLAKSLTELGCDVVLIGPSHEPLQRLANLINDHREVNERFGRATAVKSLLQNEKETFNALSACVQAFGSLEIVIDTQTLNHPTPLLDDASTQLLADQGTLLIQSRYWLAKTLVGFFKNRKRGRLIFIAPKAHANGGKLDVIGSLVNGSLSAFANSVVSEFSTVNATCNVIYTGPTEEFLIAHCQSELSPKDALEKYKILHPESKLLDSDRVSNLVTFLCSPSGQGITGQTLTVT